MNRRRALLLLLLLPFVALAAFSPHLRPSFAQNQASPTTSVSGLPTLVPAGALLTIASPDFAGLLQSWSTSPESAAWLHSANYSVFTNSRLFGRLSAAQDEFASTAKLSQAGTTLLQQVAGQESIFAWYDIGELQFLYITRLPAGRAQQTDLFAQRASFERRQTGASVFYVRSQVVSGTRRTVAFAQSRDQSGDLLLLSTREDLIAGALDLIAGKPASSSLANEPWYIEASATQPTGMHPPDLHMVLNLERIVPMPYFRSYWIQQNITELKQDRSAVSDLYRGTSASGPRFREERTLLPQPASPNISDPDLGSLAALIPPGTGVFRAQSADDPSSAVTLLNEKLLTHASDVSTRATSAPDPSLTSPLAGDASDLETRIDTPAPVSASASTAALADLIRSASLQATLSLDTASQESGPWLPIHTAVVLRTGHPLPPQALRDALQQALRGSLTASSLGIELISTPGNPSILALSGPKSLFLAQVSTQSAALTLFSDDLPTLTALLTRVPASAEASPEPARLIAGFNHAGQRAPYARLTTLIDGPASPATPGQAPAFFSANLKSLSDTFARLQTQQVVVRHQGRNIHQTVTYQWTP